MAEENVELVRRYFAAHDEGGLDEVDALAEFLHPDVSWRAAEGALDDVGVFHGHEAMWRYYRQWDETFDSMRAEIEELIETGDQVVAFVRGVGRLKASDAEVDIRYAIVFTFRDGKISKGREYFSRQDALEAAGLSE